MKQHKLTIAGKLILYFAALLLIFSAAICCVFSLLFTNQTTQIHKQDLGKKATSIAQTLGEFMSQRSSEWGRGNGCRNGMGQGGYGAYLKFLDEIAMTDVWVMDQYSNLLVFSHGEDTMNYADLPPDAEKVIDEALSGETAFSESFSELIGTKSITVGTPIHDEAQNVIGVVLLHTPVQGIDAAITGGLSLLGISVILALTLAIFSAIPLAWHFTKPLRCMKNVAVALAEGDYAVKTQIVQHDEIGDLAVTLDWMSEKLSNAAQESAHLAQMRQDFVANISHELRTPVTVLRGSLEALCDEVVTDPDMVREYHLQMRTDSIYLERLVNDLLDLSRLQNVDFAIEKSNVNLCDVVRDVARSMQRVAEKKALHLAVECPALPCCVTGDYGRLRQMLLIITDNALKFSNTPGTVFIQLDNKSEQFVISVTDQGVVIPKESLQLIFDRFHKSRDEQNKTGTGLGLAIAKQIALRHGIDIHAESSSEQTTFSMIFPDAP